MAKFLLTTIKILLAACLFVVLIVKTDMIFPYVAAKAIVFRTLAGLAFVFYLALSIADPNYWPNFKNPLVIAVSVFALSMIVSSLFGMDVIKSLWGDIERSEGVFQYLHYYIYFLMVVSVLKTRRDFEIMMLVFLGISVLIAGYGWGQYFGFKGFTLNDQPLDRIYSTLGNAIYLAAVMIFAIFFAIYFIFKKYDAYSQIYRGLLLLAIFLFILTFFQSSTRGAVFGMALAAVSAGLLFIFWLPQKYFKYKKIAVLSLVFLALIIGFISYFKDDISFIKNSGLFYRLIDFSVIVNIKDTPRFWSWQTAVKGFLEKPILGWGAENYSIVFNKYFDIRHYGGYNSETWFDRSHNMLLDVMVAQGIIGLISYLAILAVALYLIFRMAKRNPEKKFLAIWMVALLAAYFGQNMLVFDTLNTYILFYLFLGFIYSESKDQAGIKEKIEKKIDSIKNKVLKNETSILPSLFILLFIWCLIAWWGNYLPYKSNKLLGLVFRAIQQDFKTAVFAYQEALKINSPFTLLDIQRRSMTPLLQAILSNEIAPEEAKSVAKLLLTEGEKALKSHP